MTPSRLARTSASVTTGPQTYCFEVCPDRWLRYLSSPADERIVDHHQRQLGIGRQRRAAWIKEIEILNLNGLSIASLQLID